MAINETILLLLMMLIAIAYLVIFVSTLVHQAKRGRWVWFVLTLIFNITLCVYWITWIFSDKFKNKKK